MGSPVMAPVSAPLICVFRFLQTLSCLSSGLFKISSLRLSLTLFFHPSRCLYSFIFHLFSCTFPSYLFCPYYYYYFWLPRPVVKRWKTKVKTKLAGVAWRKSSSVGTVSVPPMGGTLTARLPNCSAGPPEKLVETNTWFPVRLFLFFSLYLRLQWLGLWGMLLNEKN